MQFRFFCNKNAPPKASDFWGAHQNQWDFFILIFQKHFINIAKTPAYYTLLVRKGHKKQCIRDKILILTKLKHFIKNSQTTEWYNQITKIKKRKLLQCLKLQKQTRRSQMV